MKGKFEKGDPRINREGRPGKPNKSNTDLRKMIREFCSGVLDFESMMKDFESLKPEQKFRVRNDLLKYLLPDPINIERLTGEELEELFEVLKLNKEEYFNEQKKLN